MLKQYENEKISVLLISGNTRPDSVNEQILIWIAERFKEQFNFRIYNRIGDLPHFRSDLTGDEAPLLVKEFYNSIEKADAVVICSPEYVYSLPGSIKNALDWTVSTTLFTNKPLANIVASLAGHHASKELKLIMTTLGAKIHPHCDLLISSIKTKIDKNGIITSEEVINQVDRLMERLVATVFDLAEESNDA